MILAPKGPGVEDLELGDALATELARAGDDEDSTDDPKSLHERAKLSAPLACCAGCGDVPEGGVESPSAAATALAAPTAASDPLGALELPWSVRPSVDRARRAVSATLRGVG